MSIPPPDISYDIPQPVAYDNVFILCAGFIHAEPDIEFLARSGDEFFRFYMPKHARLVRDYWKHIGVTNVLKLAEGSYEDARGGLGPLKLVGLAVGEDDPVLEKLADDESEEPVISVGTKLLFSVRVES